MHPGRMQSLCAYRRNSGARQSTRTEEATGVRSEEAEPSIAVSGLLASVELQIATAGRNTDTIVGAIAFSSPREGENRRRRARSSSTLRPAVVRSFLSPRPSYLAIRFSSSVLSPSHGSPTVSAILTSQPRRLRPSSYPARPLSRVPLHSRETPEAHRSHCLQADGAPSLPFRPALQLSSAVSSEL